MTQLTVYIDGLTQNAACLETDAALQTLLAIGQSKLLNPNSATSPLHALLCANCGLNFSFDCPVAALTMLGESDAPIETETYWLLATPVHLTLQRDFFSLTEAVTLSEAESLALIAILNTHFAADGYVFSVTPSLQWLLKMPTKRELLTTPMAQVIGRDTRPFMPKGADLAWAAQLTNEIQMLLFEHPLNQAREAHGELAANSIWLSGAGSLPEMPSIKSNQPIYTANAFAKGVAKHAQLPLFAAPPSLDQWLTNNQIYAQNTSDILIWTDLATTQHDWFAEILQLLKKRKLKRIKLNIEFSGKLLQLSLNHWDVWKFWRKRKPLQTYFSV